MRQYEARVRGEVEVDVTCASCGHAVTARVAATGSGTALSFVGFDRAHARGEAEAEAEAALVHQAHVTMALVPCVRCGHRSRAAVAGFAMWAGLGALAILGIAAFAWWADVRWLSLLFVAFAIGVVVSAARNIASASTRVLAVRPRATVPAAVVVARASTPRREVAPAAPIAPPPSTDDAPRPADGGPSVLR